MHTVTITLEEYNRLRKAERFLDALETVGVDNWQGYADACEIYRNEPEEE